MSRPDHFETGRRARGLACLLATLILTGCASAATAPEDLTPILPRSESRLETAPPAARDELKKALGWIAEDAPRTEVSKPSRDGNRAGSQR